MFVCHPDTHGSIISGIIRLYELCRNHPLLMDWWPFSDLPRTIPRGCQQTALDSMEKRGMCLTCKCAYPDVLGSGTESGKCECPGSVIYVSCSRLWDPLPLHWSALLPRGNLKQLWSHQSWDSQDRDSLAKKEQAALWKTSGSSWKRSFLKSEAALHSPTADSAESSVFTSLADEWEPG